MKHKVLFIFPNTSNRGKITTAVPILAARVRHLGWDIGYFDTSFYDKSDDSVLDREKTGGFMPSTSETIPDMIPGEKLVTDLQKLVDDYRPDIVAITAMTGDYQYLMSFFPQIKMPENTIVIIGGIHVTFEPDKVMDSGLFDLGCIGQGEAVLDELLATVDEGGKIDNIHGTYFYDKKNGKITKNPKHLLLPAEELWRHEETYSFYDDRYFIYPFDGKSVKMFWVDLGRGCPYSCSYCGNTALKEFSRGLGKFIVSRPLDSTFKLLKKMVNKYNIDVFNITHECFLIHSKEWLEEFAYRWSKEIRKSFLIVTRAETVKEEKLNILKKSNAPIIQVGIGVESGSESILHDVCNRKVKNESAIKAYKLIDKLGFRTSAYWMLGFPYETREDIFKSIELCKTLNADVDSVSIFQPMPGQPLTEVCIKEGLFNADEEISTFTGGSVLNMPQISAKEIYELRRAFILYAKLPYEYWPEIEKCEKNYDSNKDLYDELVSMRWKYAKQSALAVI